MIAPIDEEEHETNQVENNEEDSNIKMNML